MRKKNMNNLKCRKQKFNGSFECKKTKKIINIKECNNCKFKEYGIATKPIKKRTSKLAKLERNRYSVFTNDLSNCFYHNKECYGTITKHELFAGRNRQRSMKYGFVIPLCHYHHSSVQNNAVLNQYWHNRCRNYWLKNYGNLDQFIKVFGKSYL